MTQINLSKYMVLISGTITLKEQTLKFGGDSSVEDDEKGNAAVD